MMKKAARDFDASQTPCETGRLRKKGGLEQWRVELHDAADC
jgi:hypothetical protein